MPTLKGLTDWLGGPVLTLILLFLAIGLLSRAHKGDYKRIASGVGCMVLGLLVLGLALTGNAGNVAKSIANAVFA